MSWLLSNKYKVCHKVMKNILSPMGCRSPTCIAHHSCTTISEVSKFSFFHSRHKANNPTTVMSQAMCFQWLQLRDDNRQRITKFSSIEEIENKIPNHYMFRNIKRFQLELFKNGSLRRKVEEKEQKVVECPIDVKNREENTAWLSEMKKVLDTDKFEELLAMKTSIGNGSFGEVYFIMTADASTCFALKVALEEKDSDSILEEYEVRRQLGPPVVTGLITYAGYRNGILMKHYSHSLSDWKKFLTLSQRRLLMPHILFQLAQGLDTLHSKNYLFNDIKCRNILMNCDTFTPENINALEVVLADLGSVAPRHQETYGTKMYQAPEVSLLDKYASTRSDIYSLGLSMVEFVQGTSEEFDKFTDRINTLPHDFPLRSLIKSMIHYDSNKRPYAFEIIAQINIYKHSIKSF